MLQLILTSRQPSNIVLGSWLMFIKAPMPVSSWGVWAAWLAKTTQSSFAFQFSLHTECWPAAAQLGGTVVVTGVPRHWVTWCAFGTCKPLWSEWVITVAKSLRRPDPLSHELHPHFHLLPSNHNKPFFYLLIPSSKSPYFYPLCFKEHSPNLLDMVNFYCSFYLALGGRALRGCHGGISLKVCCVHFVSHTKRQTVMQSWRF